jgi:chemotaxis protein methyltransferase CheR
MVNPLHLTATIDDTEIEVLAILHETLGYDPGEIDPKWLHARLREQVLGEGLETTRGLREKLLHDSACRDRLVRRLGRSGRRLFDEPDFYRGFLSNIVPFLRTYPFIRIWHMGCGTGEQVYSMAILLQEAGIYDRCRLYATDGDEAGLRHARTAAYDLETLKSSEAKYRASGGHSRLSSFYSAQELRGIFDHSLVRNIVFAQHNVLTDGVFNEFQVIICRDVLSLFDPTVAARVVDLLRGSLVRLGFLSLGQTEQAPGRDTGMRYQQFGPAGTFRRLA